MDRQLWLSILQLSSQIRQEASINVVAIQMESSSIVFNPRQIKEDHIYVHLEPLKEVPETGIHIVLKNKFEAHLLRQGNLDQDTWRFLVQYLPYCFLSYWAKKEKRAISVSHFAQSLDGKIATLSGDSKWIGNPENLKHAHMMRALCEGIIIGSGTLVADEPSLTVRHVEGKNPKRVVIGSRESKVSILFKSSPDPVILVCPQEQREEHQNIHHLHIPQNGKSRIWTNTILKELFKLGIYSVYVEGGSRTTSNFLADNAIDILQLHISPQIFGSGINGVELPTIEYVKEAICFDNFLFHQVGDTIMFVGEPKLQQA